jgi:hypothetical protein
MNICCPFLCRTFHPPFRLRLVVVKAARLGLSLAGPDPSIHVEVSAGNNPRKSTSRQKLQVHGSKSMFGACDDDISVVWNEPLDLIMNPSETHIRVEVFYAGTFGHDVLGHVDIPIDVFYESPGTCENVVCCGWYPCPWLCHRFCAQKYAWPAVIGAPRAAHMSTWMKQLSKNGDVWSSLASCSCDAMQQAHTQSYDAVVKKLGHPRAWSEYSCLQAVSKNGLVLEYLHDQWQGSTPIENETWYHRVLIAAIRNNPEAVKFVPRKFADDDEVRRVAHDVPKPMIMELQKCGADVGRIWLYFMLNDVYSDADAFHNV